MRYGPNRAVRQAASRRLDAIVVGERYRRDPGDLAALAASIDELGLLHPIVIRPDGTLIAGARRLAAVTLLGWTNVAVRVIDLDEIARGEFAENVCRKDFTLSEAVAIKRALEPVEREAAKERQREGGRAGRQPSGNLPQASKGRAADRAAKATGMARRTFEKAEAVVDAAETEPERFGKLLADMDRAGRANGVYRRLQNIRAAEATRPARKLSGKQNDFAMVPLGWAADVTEAMNTPGYMVFTLLAYLAWKSKSSTFVLSNDCLKRYGVDRDAKRRALARREKAGVIRIERHGRHAPKVTLLIEPASRV